MTFLLTLILLRKLQIYIYYHFTHFLPQSQQYAKTVKF